MADGDAGAALLRDLTGGGWLVSRRGFLQASAAVPLSMALSRSNVLGGQLRFGDGAAYDLVRTKVPDPEVIKFSVAMPGKPAVELVGHYWYNSDARARGVRTPAIVEFNPYRRRDGTMIADSKMYPWFAYNEYMAVRVDLQGTGDSSGVITDEYTEEELAYCRQVIEQVAVHPLCDGNVGMMGKSWSAINSLMVAGRQDCPRALKAIIVCCGSDDRYNDDVHYMGGAMMFDNISWPSSMWGWLALPPDPLVVGEAWKERWRERVRGADFWFKQWAGHQVRDSYWTANSVRGHFEDVQVPVFVLAGWQDGYKNPVERVVSGLAAAGKPVRGLIGPWGHKYPYNGFPGPQTNWLFDAVSNWWDQWLKGNSAANDAIPQFTVWLGESREPDKSPCEDERGRWIAEDGDWNSRAENVTFALAADRKLESMTAPTVASSATLKSPRPLVVATEMLETSSWGACGNDDLAGDQSKCDAESLYFDSEPLEDDLDCFGYPTVKLNLTSSVAVASLAVRVCEVSPASGASRLVTYRFFNLCQRDGDMAAPRRLQPGEPFSAEIPLTITGHTFKKGWRIRLAISTSFFPTLWQAPENAAIELTTGGITPSCLTIPTRRRRIADAAAEIAMRAPTGKLHVDPEPYVPTLAETRPAATTREVEETTIDGKPAVVVKKVFDSGRYQYGGPLAGMWVDQVATENFAICPDDPLSLVASTTSTTIFERPTTGWRTHSETTTRVWSEKPAGGQAVFRYAATMRAYVGTADGGKELFEEKSVAGTISREWV